MEIIHDELNQKHKIFKYELKDMNEVRAKIEFKNDLSYLKKNREKALQSEILLWFIEDF